MEKIMLLGDMDESLFMNPVKTPEQEREWQLRDAAKRAWEQSRYPFIIEQPSDIEEGDSMEDDEID